MARELLVEGDKKFKLGIPDDAKVTFGPWSPPSDKGYGGDGARRGTLRVYASDGKHILGVFSGVVAFRDTSAIEYAEEVAVEEGARIWKSDKDGYQREEKFSVKREWTAGLPATDNL